HGGGGVLDRRDAGGRGRRRALALATRTAAHRARRPADQEATRQAEPRAVFVRGAVPVLKPVGDTSTLATHERNMTRYTVGMTGMAAAILLAATGYAAEFKVAVVDMQRALNECEAGKHAKDQVKAKFEKAQDQLKRQRDDLDRARDDFDKKALVLKEDQRRDLEKEFEVKSLDFKRKYEDFQRDLKR